MAQVKICGLSTEATLNAALDHGADFVGLMFYAPSPRNISFEKAALLSKIAKGRAQTVAVVVDADDDFLQAIKEYVQPDYIQVHGAETLERIRSIKQKFDVKVIKVIKVKDQSDVELARLYRPVADLIMFDPKAPKDALPGGNGLSFDWAFLKDVEGPFMLAGGLKLENVATAIRLTHAPIVDVSSGVETAPGTKDSQLIAKFIKAAKSA
jgi:phosphoribosylanthranilate isomerase